VSTSTCDHGANWYAVSTRSRHEQIVVSQLRDKRVETLFPTVTRWSRRKDRRQKIQWPLFPGYCFARFDVADRLTVLTCRGVVKIVSFGGVPAPVPTIEIDSLRTLMETRLKFDPCPLVPEGAMVEVTRGPLCGVVGRLVRKDCDRATVVLSVDLIGQGVRLELDASDIRVSDQHSNRVAESAGL
jgi:transcriptional antiterminator NusG